MTVFQAVRSMIRDQLHILFWNLSAAYPLQIRTGAIINEFFLSQDYIDMIITGQQNGGRFCTYVLAFV